MISFLFFYKRLIDINSISSKIYIKENLKKYKNQDFLIFRSNYLNDWFEEILEIGKFHYSEFSFSEDFLNLIKRLDEKTVLNLLETIREFDSKEFSEEEFGKAFEYIIEISDLNHSRSGLVRTPRDILELMTKILNPTIGKLLDPVCGTGGFLTEANRLSSNLELVGIEINYKVARIAEMNLIVNGREEGIIRAGNCFNVAFNNGSYDFIIGDLPIEGGIIGEESYSLTDNWGIQLPTKSKGFGAFLLFALSNLSYSGKAVFTISDSFLYRKGADQKIRDLLIDKDIVESIISLPNGALKPYTRGKASIIVLNNNKRDQLINHVQFIDLSNPNIYQELGVNEIIKIYKDRSNRKYSQIVSKREIFEFHTLNPKYFTQNFWFLRDLLVSGNGKYLNDVSSYSVRKKSF